MPHGVCNMSEQSRISHLNQDSQIRQTRKLFLGCLKVKETLQSPKTLISSPQAQRTSSVLHCNFLWPFPCSYLPRCRIRKGALAQSKEFLLWLLLSNCFVTVKAAGERVEAQQCIPTWNATILTLLKVEKLCTSSVGSREIPAGGKKTPVKTNNRVCGPASENKGKNIRKLQDKKMKSQHFPVTSTMENPNKHIKKKAQFKNSVWQVS